MIKILRRIRFSCRKEHNGGVFKRQTKLIHRKDTVNKETKCAAYTYIIKIHFGQEKIQTVPVIMRDNSGMVQIATSNRFPYAFSYQCRQL